MSPRYFVPCQECGEEHPADYSHEGRFNEGPIYVVFCTKDGLADYYTAETLIVRPDPEDTP